MRVEIDNVREIKEAIITSDGSLFSKMPEYAGYVAKIVVLDQKGREIVIPTEHIESQEKGEKETISNRIEGLKYGPGHKRSRETAKQFAKLISDSGLVKERKQPWIILKNGNQIRYGSSVVYEGIESDYLWYSLDYNNLTGKENAYLSFIIRDSNKMVYLPLKEVIKDFKKARDLRNNDWLHFHLIFVNGKVKMEMKTGKGNAPIEREFSREKYYVSWNEFLKVVEG